jgi:hypothetical protein
VLLAVLVLVGACAIAGCADNAGQASPADDARHASAAAPEGTSSAASAPSPAGTAAPRPRPSASPGCATGDTHFSIDSERTTPTVCLPVGGVVDLAAVAAGGTAPGMANWTAVSSSDPAVVRCTAVADDPGGGAGPTGPTCRAVASGRATVTATGTSGAWHLQIFVHR